MAEQGALALLTGQVRGVLFDLDNTLYDRDAAFRAWAIGFVADRLPGQDERQRRETVEILVAWDAHGYCPRHTLFARIQEQYACLPMSVERMASTFSAQLCHYLAPEPDTERLLNVLEGASLPFGIVTNGSPGQRHKIAALGLQERTSCVFISSLFGARKPEPAIFLAAADCLDIPPHEVLFVGDNPEADILGARRVGMRAAWVQRGQSWPAHLGPCCADLTVRTLVGLTPAVSPS